ncbi:hypothetical protein M0R45_032874 [Rubus argutus]|uniref:PAZ domain-containing protein n=1 Tax=Rubus argutus TaxID=59490 RepID=A0AAW1WLJ9_RUBAR
MWKMHTIARKPLQSFCEDAYLLSILLFYQYSVHITSEGKRAVEGNGIGRKLVDGLYQTYSSALASKKFAYDGEKALYTVGPLPQNKLEFTVELEETFAKSPSGVTEKRARRSLQSKIFTVELSYAAKIPLKSIALALKGADVDNTQEALRVLDIILQQQAVNMGCLLVRQPFFHDDSRNFTDVGAGVIGVRAFHSSFRTHLNMEPRNIDWVKAKRMLKNMRIKTRHCNMEFKIIGISEKPCNLQFFPMKLKTGDGASEGETTDITVFEYFTKHCGIELTYSAYLPCLDGGKPKRPNYLPLELCVLVSLRRQKPQDRIRTLTDAVSKYHYDSDLVLTTCGISIEKQLTQIEGCILDTPKVGNSEDCIPFKGRWNFNNKTLLNPTRIDRWIVVNFSARCDTSHISRELINSGRKKGILIERPFMLLEEEPRSRRQSHAIRVEKMFEQIQTKLPSPPTQVSNVPEEYNGNLYCGTHMLCPPCCSTNGAVHEGSMFFC